MSTTHIVSVHTAMLVIPIGQVSFVALGFWIVVPVKSKQTEQYSTQHSEPEPLTTAGQARKGMTE